MTLKGVGTRVKDIDVQRFLTLPVGRRHRDLILIAGPFDLETKYLPAATQDPIKQRAWRVVVDFHMGKLHHERGRREVWNAEWSVMKEKSASNATLEAASAHPIERPRIVVAVSRSTLSFHEFAPDVARRQQSR